MPAQYGKMMCFILTTGWGFAKIDGTEVKVLVHRNQKCRVIWTGPAPDDLVFQQTAPDEPDVGTELVLDTRQNARGAKAIAWAFRHEWDKARRSVALASKPAEAKVSK